MATLVMAGCSAPATRGGVVSTNPCADAMLVRLVPPARIAAISHYSQEPGATSLPLGVARRFRTTAGTAEEVIALRPSLVLTSSFTPPATRDAYARAGLRMLVLDSPATVAASEAQVREVAAALGARARGEAVVRGMKAAFKDELCPANVPKLLPGTGRGTAAPLGAVGEGARGVRTRPAPLHHASGMVPPPASGEDPERASSCVRSARTGSSGSPSALLFLSGDLATGSGTLLDELLTRAGFRNAAADYGLRFTGRVPIEAIAKHPPDMILAPDAGRTAALRRRVLARLGARTVEAMFPRALINCGGPTISPAMARLRAIRASLP